MSTKQNSIWQRPNLVERLTELHTVEKLSTARIANQLSTEFGLWITRNAVIGKINRIGLPPHTEPGFRRINREGTTPRQRPRKPRRVDGGVFVHAPKINPRKFVCSDVEANPLHLTLDDLQYGQCRYPYGDGPYTFCGCERFANSSYCEPHYFLCWQPTTGSDRAAIELRKRAYSAKMIAEAA